MMIWSRLARLPDGDTFAAAISEIFFDLDGDEDVCYFLEYICFNYSKSPELMSYLLASFLEGEHSDVVWLWILRALSVSDYQYSIDKNALTGKIDQLMLQRCDSDDVFDRKLLYCLKIIRIFGLRDILEQTIRAMIINRRYVILLRKLYDPIESMQVFFGMAAGGVDRSLANFRLLFIHSVWVLVDLADESSSNTLRDAYRLFGNSPDTVRTIFHFLVKADVEAYYAILCRLFDIVPLDGLAPLDFYKDLVIRADYDPSCFIQSHLIDHKAAGLEFITKSWKQAMPSELKSFHQNLYNHLSDFHPLPYNQKPLLKLLSKLI